MAVLVFRVILQRLEGSILETGQVKRLLVDPGVRFRSLDLLPGALRFAGRRVQFRSLDLLPGALRFAGRRVQFQLLGLLPGALRFAGRRVRFRLLDLLQIKEHLWAVLPLNLQILGSGLRSAR